MRRILLLCLALILGVISACRHSTSLSPQIKMLKDRIEVTQSDLDTFETRLKAVGGDLGQQISLNRQNEMNKCRLERLRGALADLERWQKEQH